MGSASTIVVILFLASIMSIRAAEYQWQQVDEDFTVSSAWEPQVVPKAGDTAYLGCVGPSGDYVLSVSQQTSIATLKIGCPTPRALLRLSASLDISASVISNSLVQTQYRIEAPASSTGTLRSSFTSGDLCDAESGLTGKCLNIRGDVIVNPSSTLNLISAGDTNSLPPSNPFGIAKNVSVRGSIDIFPSGTLELSSSSSNVMLKSTKNITLQGGSTLRAVFSFNNPEENSPRFDIINPISISGQGATIMSLKDIFIQGNMNINTGATATIQSALSVSATSNINIQGSLTVSSKVFSSTGTLNIPAGAGLILAVSTSTKISGTISGAGSIRVPINGTISAAVTGTTINHTVVSSSVTYSGQHTSSRINIASGTKVSFESASSSTTFGVTGTLALNQGTHTNPSVSIASGGVVTSSSTSTLSGGIYTVQSGGSLTIGGAATSGTYTVSGTLIVNSAVSGLTVSVLSGGLVNFTNTISGATVIVESGGRTNVVAGSSNCVFTSSGTLLHVGAHAGSTFTINGGTATVSAPSSASSATSITVSGGNSHSFVGNFGTTPFSISSAVTFSSATVDVVTITGTPTVTFSSSTVSSVLQQSGTATVQLQGTTVTSGLSIDGGALVVTTGVLTDVSLTTTAGSSVTMTGVSAVKNTWNLVDSAVTITGASFSAGTTINTNAGTNSLTGSFSDTIVNVQGGTTTLGTSTISGSSTFTCSSATCNVGGTGTFSAVTVAGTASVSGAINATQFNWNGGTIQANVRVGGGGGVFSTATNVLHATGTLTILGSVAWSGGDITINGQLNLGSTFALISAFKIMGTGSIVSAGQIGASGITVNTVRVTGGSIDLSGGSLSVSTLQIDAGAIQDAVISASSAVTISTTSAKELRNCQLSNSGIFTWNQGRLTLTSTSLMNEEAGKMYLDGTELVDGGQSTVTNAGNLFKNDPSTTTLGLPFHNTGTFVVLNGALSVNRLFTCSGTVNITQQATFIFADLDINLENTCSIMGGGILGFRNLRATMNGLFSISRIEVNASLVLGQSQNLNELILLGGSISGASTGVELVAEDMAWSGGQMLVPFKVSDALTIANSAQVTGSGTTSKLILSAPLGILSGGSLQASTITMTTPITVSGSGTLVVLQSFQVTQNLHIETATLDNRGTITISTGATLWATTLTCQTGATVATQTGGTLTLSSSTAATLPQCSVTGTGVLAFNTSVVTIDKALVQVNNIALHQSTLNLNSNFEFGSGTLTMYGSILQNSGVNATLSSIIVNGASTIVNNGGSSVLTLNNLAVPVNSRLEVSGATQLSQVPGTWNIGGILMLSNSGLTAASGSVLSVDAGGLVSFAAGTSWVLNTGSNVNGQGSVESYGQVDIFTNTITVQNLTLFGTPVFHSDGTFTLSSFSVAGSVKGSKTTIQTSKLNVVGGSLYDIYVISASTTIAGNLELFGSNVSHSGTPTVQWNSGIISLNSSHFSAPSVSVGGAVSVISNSASNTFTTTDLSIGASSSLSITRATLKVNGQMSLSGELSLVGVPFTCSSYNVQYNPGAALSLTGDYTVDASCNLNANVKLSINSGTLTVTTPFTASELVASNGQVVINTANNITVSALTVSGSTIQGDTNNKLISVSGAGSFVNAVVSVDLYFGATSNVAISGTSEFTMRNVESNGIVNFSGSLNGVAWRNNGQFTATSITAVNSEFWNSNSAFIASVNFDAVHHVSGSLTATYLETPALFWLGGNLNGGVYHASVVSFVGNKKRATTQKTMTGSTIVVSSELLLEGDLILQSSSSLVISPGAVFNLPAASLLSGSSSSLLVNGTFSVVSNQNFRGLHIYNSGNITQSAGVSVLASEGDNNGLWTLGSQARLEVSSLFVVGPSGALIGNATIATSNAGRLVVPGNLSVSNIELNHTSSGNANIPASFNGSISWFGGSVTTLSVANTGLLFVSAAGANRSLSGTLTNRGTATILGDVLVSSTGTIRNEAAGLLTVTGAMVGPDPRTGVFTGGNLINAGSLTVSPASAMSQLNVVLDNSGKLYLSSNAYIYNITQHGLRASTVLSNNPRIVISNTFLVGAQSVFSGSGDVSGVFVNEGELHVGPINSTEPAILIFSGTFRTMNDSVVHLDAFNVLAYDFMNFSGTSATLFGNLALNLLFPAPSENSARVPLLVYKNPPVGFLNEDDINYGLNYEGVNPQTGYGVAILTTNNAASTIGPLPTPDPQIRGGGGGGLSGGGIAGVVIGVLAACVVVIAIAAFMYRKKSKQLEARELELAPLAPPTSQDTFEHSFLFYHRIFQPNHPDKRIRTLDPLHSMLIESNLALVNAVYAITRNEDAEISPSLTYLLEAKGTYFRWFENLLADEVKNCNSQETLFRGNTIFTKSMTTYAVMTSNGYLHDMLFEPLRKVVGMSDLDGIDLADLKHDPKKTAPINAMKLCMDWVFDALDGSVDKVPVHLRIMSNMIKLGVAKKYQDAELLALGGFFFLRFVCPPLTTPSKFGLINKGVGEKAVKAQISVGGLLQKIANKAKYTEKGKYPHLSILNPFIDQQYERLTRFLEAISRIDSNVGIPEPVEIPTNVLQISLAYLYNKIVKDLDKLVPKLIGIPAPPADYKPPTDQENFYNSFIAPVYVQSQAVVSSPSLSSIPSSPSTPATPKPLLASLSSSSAISVGSNQITSEQYSGMLRELSSHVPQAAMEQRLSLLNRLNQLIHDVGTAPFVIYDPDTDYSNTKKSGKGKRKASSNNIV